MVCQMKARQPMDAASSNGNLTDSQAMETAIKMSLGKKEKSEKSVRYSGRFVKESFGDKTVFLPGQKFTKSWIMRNDGWTAWDTNTFFAQTNGDDLGAAGPVVLNCKVQPEQEHTWEMSFTAPLKPGRYTAYFRMQLGTSIRFGHKVWCDILVDEPVKIAEQLSVPEELTDKLDASQPLMISSVITPKQRYFAELEEVKCTKAKAMLAVLFEAGFSNFQVNKSLLEKYNNDVEKVAS